MQKLCDMKCKACKGESEPLQAGQIMELSSQLHENWEVIDGHNLRREFKFKNFAQALEFVNKIGEIAEAEQHHPDIHLTWGRVLVELFTHAIGGMSENDFIVAAKIDKLAG